MLEVYTLEKHLENLSKVNEEYEILNSIWKLNKKNLGNALTTVQVTFPHYSLHDSTHSNTILRNIESFLGEERIKMLSPTDTWMLIMAAYTHDLGMVVFYNALEKKWNEADFKDFLEDTKESVDIDLARSAEIILQLSNNNPNPDKDFNFPLKVRSAVTLLSAEYFRKTHFYRSNDVLKGIDENFTNILSDFYSDQIPNRFLEVLGRIAEAHGSEFEYIFDKLEFQANGIANDKIHPRFIACMLRLGDLLDIDDKRFSKFQENIFATKLPDSSEIHKKKHASTEHLNISPLGIEATVDCKGDDRVFRIARQWFDWLEGEIKNQNLKWHKIVPKNLGGSAPILSKEKILVLSNGKEPLPGFMNLRFDISSSKVFEILEGKALYNDPEFVFLRELVQNAKDASNIQLWIDIQKGYYDHFIRESLTSRCPSVNFKKKNHKELIEAISFPDDIPHFVYNNYIIDLNLIWSNESKEFLIIEVIDQGTGISDKNLIRMTSHVGDSRKYDKDFKKFKDNMPYWLKPTGAFGLGLQSVFMVVKEFDIHTKAEGEEAKKITLRSAKNREYCSLEMLNEFQQRGSKVVIKFPKNSLEKIYGQSNFSIDVISSFDAFSEDREELYLKKILKYIRENLLYTSKINISTPHESITYEEISSTDNANIPLFRDQNFEIKSFKSYDDLNNWEVLFEINENKFIGSTINLSFIQSFEAISFRYSNPEYDNKIFVRGVSVPENKSYATSFGLRYCAFSIDLLDRDSDKILNIARTKLLTEYYREIKETVRTQILPNVINRIIQLIDNQLNNIESSDDKKKIALLYFHVLLTAKMFNVDTSLKNESVLKSYKFPKYIILGNDKKEINFLEFFNINRVAVLRLHRREKATRIHHVSDDSKHKSDWITRNNILNGKIDGILISEGYLEDYFWSDGLKVTEVLISEDFKFQNQQLSYKIYINEKNSDPYPFVKMSKDDIKFELVELVKNRDSGDRNKILPLQQYGILATKDVYISGFEYFSNYTHHGILSPFKSMDDVVRLKEILITQIKDAQIDGNTSPLADMILKDHINNLIPVNMINWTISNSTYKKIGSLTSHEIKEGYSQLIADYLVLVP